MAFSGFGTTTPAFGTTTTPFGQTTTASTTTTPTFGGFGTSFPSLSTTTATTPAFGSTTAPATTTPSLFGTTATPTLGTTSTTNPFGGFGTTTPATTSPFGTTTAPATTSPFGSTATPTLGTTSTASPFTTTFGASSATTPVFGTTTPAPTTPSTSSLFPTTPAPTSTLFSSQTQSQVTPQPSQPTQQTPLQKMEALYCCFNPQHPQCKFRHMFYNQINANPEDVKRMNTMKPPQVDQLLWDQACRNNPDPTKFVPVQACGFEDLKQRIAEQNKLTNQQSQTLQDATKLIDHIRHEHTNNTMAKLDDYKRRQLEISQRLIRVICKLMVLEARGTRLTVGEEQLKRKFEMILQDLASPVLYRAKIEDFIALSRISVPSTPLPQVDEKALENIAKALKEQRAGLEVLTTMVQKDTKDVQLMMNELNSQ
eukprot:Phypoly_transcript_02451.p1 GENE.Phypoly_transcript_02451~~Phypoly_transcript_02451.p1  ORF type:complete len:426 (-),score=78.36 Phypoly_transcript_02451:230-1507(-)